jgi:hypothetical protein
MSRNLKYLGQTCAIVRDWCAIGFFQSLKPTDAIVAPSSTEVEQTGSNWHFFYTILPKKVRVWRVFNRASYAQTFCAYVERSPIDKSIRAKAAYCLYLNSAPIAQTQGAITPSLAKNPIIPSLAINRWHHLARAILGRAIPWLRWREVWMGWSFPAVKTKASLRATAERLMAIYLV